MEAPADFTQYKQFVEMIFNTKQGIVLARSLSLTDSHVFDAYTWADNVHYKKTCVSLIDEVINYHLICLRALYLCNYIEAYDYQRAIVIVVMQLMEEEMDTNWMLPLMYTVCIDLRRVAIKADVASNSHGAILENAAACLIACFQICVSDDDGCKESNKKLALLIPVNNLLRIYFRLDKHNLCRPIIKAVEYSAAGGSFSVAQQIIFKFYVGRLAMLEGDYRKAEKYLLFAFKKCYEGSFNNKQLILTYLVPVKLLLGFMPTKPLVDKYGLSILWNLATAMKAGDLKQFDLIVDVNIEFFDDSGLQCTLENLRMIAVRNVFKKIYHSHNRQRIPFTCFQIGLQVMSGVDINIHQTLNLLIHLINSKKIRAYVSYHEQEIVFRADTAFPSLSTVQFPAQ